MKVVAKIKKLKPNTCKSKNRKISKLKIYKKKPKYGEKLCEVLVLLKISYCLERTPSNY